MGNSWMLNVLFDNSGSMMELGRPFLLRNILYTIKDYFKLNDSPFIPKFYLFSEKIVPLPDSENGISFSPAEKVDWMELESFLNKSSGEVVNLVVSDFSLYGANMIQRKKVLKWIKEKRIMALNISDFIQNKNLFCSVEDIIALLDSLQDDGDAEEAPSNISDLKVKQTSMDTDNNRDWE